MGAAESKEARRNGAIDKDGVRRLPGNCNSTSLDLVMVDGDPQPLVTVSGNCNEVKITITQIDCVHGTHCTNKEKPDRPVRISGNCNSYKIEVISYGLPGKEMLRVTGNANDAKVTNMRTPKKINCDCAGPMYRADEQPDLLGEDPAPPVAPVLPTPRATAMEQPPPYEPRVESVRSGEADDVHTKTLLMSSISSLDGTDSTNDDAFTDANSRRSSLGTVNTIRA